MADPGAVLDGHAARTIDRLRHDLQGPPAATDHPHLHQLEAHIAESRLDQVDYLVKRTRPYADDNTKRAGACPLSTSTAEKDVARYMASIRPGAQAVLRVGRAASGGGSSRAKRR